MIQGWWAFVWQRNLHISDQAQVRLLNDEITDVLRHVSKSITQAALDTTRILESPTWMTIWVTDYPVTSSCWLLYWTFKSIPSMVDSANLQGEKIIEMCSWWTTLAGALALLKGPGEPPKAIRIAFHQTGLLWLNLVGANQILKCSPKKSTEDLRNYGGKPSEHS